MSNDASFNSLTTEELKERLFFVETANIALASILASVEGVSLLNTDDVMERCLQMCDMDADVTDATREFIDNLISIARNNHQHDEY